jgi:hypothetical protein
MELLRFVWDMYVESMACRYKSPLSLSEDVGGNVKCSLQFLRVRLSCRVHLNSSNRMSSSSDDAELVGSILNCLH